MISIETSAFGSFVVFISEFDFKVTTLNGFSTVLTIEVALWMLTSARQQPVQFCS
jgi:hypothetical protein